jgi:hypothetical protein
MNCPVLMPDSFFIVDPRGIDQRGVSARNVRKVVVSQALLSMAGPPPQLTR